MAHTGEIKSCTLSCVCEQPGRAAALEEEVNLQSPASSEGQQRGCALNLQVQSEAV